MHSMTQIFGFFSNSCGLKFRFYSKVMIYFKSANKVVWNEIEKYLEEKVFHSLYIVLGECENFEKSFCSQNQISIVLYDKCHDSDHS